MNEPGGGDSVGEDGVVASKKYNIVYILDQIYNIKKTYLYFLEDFS